MSPHFFRKSIDAISFRFLKIPLVFSISIWSENNFLLNVLSSFSLRFFNAMLSHIACRIFLIVFKHDSGWMLQSSDASLYLEQSVSLAPFVYSDNTRSVSAVKLTA